MAMTDKVKKVKRSKRKVSERALLFVVTNFNNTIVTATDMKGNTLCWASSGSCGFKGARKSTPFASRLVVDTVAKQVVEWGVKVVEVLIKGPGSGRDAVRMIDSIDGLRVSKLTDRTRAPHNGCTPKKKRRA